MFLWTVSLFKVAAGDCWISSPLRVPPRIQFLFCQSVRYSVCFKCWLSTIFFLSEILLDCTAEVAVPDYWTSRRLVPQGITMLLIEPDMIIAVWLSHCRLMFRRHLVWISVTLHTSLSWDAYSLMWHLQTSFRLLSANMNWPPSPKSKQLLHASS